MSKHIPGPWTYKAPPPNCGVRWKIYSEHRKDDGSPYAPLCEVDTEEYARLIAAAPELLQAMKDIERSACAGWNNPPLCAKEALRRCIDLSRAAIAKAEG